MTNFPIIKLAQARDLAEAINVNIREQLKGYQKFVNEDNGSHKADLEKLIEKTEAALKLTGAEEKQKILNELPQQFSAEFNEFITAKLAEEQINETIQEASEFYASLLAGHSEFKDEIEKTVSTLENLLKETDVKKKEDGFAQLNNAFTPEFSKFLQENSLPMVNRQLKNTVEFFEDLLVEKGTPFDSEIKALKTQAEAALGNISVEEKQKVLYEVTNPQNKELFEYLQKKFIETH